MEANFVRSQRNDELAERESGRNEALASVTESKFPATSNLRSVKPQDYLGYASTCALIINRMIGTGVFVVPPVVLAITGSKGISLMLWLLGGLITWAGLAMYLEYGIRFPLTGGELHYIDRVWRRPQWLMTYMYSIMFIFLSGSQANALVFGSAVLAASTARGTPVDERLQKLFAVILVAVVCLFQGFSRINYIRLADGFALYKISLLSFITVVGWCALANKRTTAATSSSDPYGVQNLAGSFSGGNYSPYAIAVALLDIMRVYGGYENANFVLEEIQRPPKDKTRIYRRGAKITVIVVTFFYLMVNVALFAACSTEELTTTSDVLSLFFTKVFGPSAKTRLASGTLLAISSTGNVMSATYVCVKVKQEIARLGILPLPEFWAKTTRLDTPGPALLLHWIFSTVFIIATPLGSVNGYLVFSTLCNYSRTVIGIVLGSALLFAPLLRSFDVLDKSWRPRGTRLGFWSVTPLTILYVLANLFIFVVSWFPSDLQNALHTKARILSGYVGPTTVVSTFGAGFAYWLWDIHILPVLGYTLQRNPEIEDGLNILVSFTRKIRPATPAKVFMDVWLPMVRTLGEWWTHGIWSRRSGDGNESD